MGSTLTIDELAASARTTTRRIRSLQTLGLLPHPELRGRTGLYGAVHQERLAAIVRLQERGFSLESLGVLFGAFDEGRSLADVLGVARSVAAGAAAETSGDSAELYGFADLQPGEVTARRAGRRLLSLVPTTMWEESAAS